MRVLTMTAAIWFGLLAMGVGLELIPWAQAEEGRPQSTTQAASQPASDFPNGLGYLSGDLGIGTANNDIGTGLNYGGELAFFPQTYLGLGAIYRGTNHGTAKSNIYGGELLLRPAKALTLGFVVGGASLQDAGPNTATSFAYGGKMGYDFRLGNTPFTLGPEVDVLFFKPGNVQITDVDMLAAFKIWI